jgi:hypothetical protein
MTLRGDDFLNSEFGATTQENNSCRKWTFLYSESAKVILFFSFTIP